MKIYLPKTQKGFTLVELLVVIAIIAILAVVGVTIFGGTQKNARDARRRADIDAIASALEANKGTATTYALLTNGSFASGTIPADAGNGGEDYAICFSTATTSPDLSGNKPTTWTNNSSVPSAPTTNCNGAIPAWEKIDGDSPLAATYTWMVCTRLEESTADTGAGLKVYCRSNSQ